MANMRQIIVLIIALVSLGQASAQDCFQWAVTPTGSMAPYRTTCVSDRIVYKCARKNEEGKYSPVECPIETKTVTKGAPSQAPTPAQSSSGYFGGVGQKVNLNFESIDIRSLFQVYADISGKSFVIDPVIRGVINRYRVVDTPWTEAILDLLQANRLSIKKTPSGYYIFPSPLTDHVAR